MRSIILTSSAFILVILTLGSLQTLWVDRQLKALNEPALVSQGSRNMAAPRGELARDRQLEALQALNPSPLHAATLHVQRFAILSRKASEETNPAQRMRLYCEALSEMGEALQSEPANATYLINWANVRQLLGNSVECSLPFTTGDYDAAAQRALRDDPANINVLFSAAQIYGWAGKDEESLRSLNRMLLLAVSPKPYQVEYIASRLRTPQDVQAVIPARFPQIAAWSARLQQEKPDLFRNSQSVLEKLQLAAIDAALAEYRAGQIAPNIYRQRLLSLPGVVASPVVRRRLDSELASFSKSIGDDQLTPYLLKRGALDETAVLDASIASDTRPLKSVLTNWGSNADMCLDDFYGSIGFYLPVGSSPKLIELRGKRKDAVIPSNMIKVLVSDDNQTWAELEGSLVIGSITFGDTKIVTIEPNSRYFKYWKINFASSAHTRSFCNSAQELITVYRTGTGGPT
ncbi:MAG: hypothetical protein J0M12_14595 [Deltaproteobacteria bacterium]|nr:hypothetical protein [Deltaproteobacteria bacterium]